MILRANTQHFRMWAVEAVDPGYRHLELLDCAPNNIELESGTNCIIQCLQAHGEDEETLDGV